MPEQILRLKSIKPFLLLSSLILCTFASFAQSWQTLAPGIEYQDLSASLLTPWSHIYVFRVDLQKNQLDVVMAKNLSKPYASANEFAEHSQALLTINGGFFDHKHRPLGLRISQYHQTNPLKKISWWGIFYTKNQKAYLKSLKQFHPSHQIDFALQSGPRLLINGQIPSLKPGVAERSALGITKDGKVILLVTDSAPMDTTALAQLMKAEPLNCINALNLDGGNSTQLSANIDTFHLSVHGLSKVSDAIVVKRRDES